MRYFCPGCWEDFAEDLDRCPHCGLNIRTFFASRDYVDKLIVALKHPEPETPGRAAWILGRRRESKAVGPLIELLRKTQDVYTASEAVRALSRIGTPEAMAFLRTLTEHPAGMVRQAVADALADETRAAADHDKAKEDADGKGRYS